MTLAGLNRLRFGPRFAATCHSSILPREELAVSVDTNQWQKPHHWNMEPSPWSYPHPVPLVKESDLLNPMLKIADVMSRQIPTCAPNASAAEGARTLRDSAFSAVFVVSDGRLLGFLTDRTLALAVADRAGQMERLTVGELMKTDVPTVAADDKLDVSVGQVRRRWRRGRGQGAASSRRGSLDQPARPSLGVRPGQAGRLFVPAWPLRGKRAVR